MRRRKFLSISTSASVLAILNAHTLLACSGSVLQANKIPKNPLITSLRLLTNVPLRDMKKFYVETIGFNLLEEMSDKLIIKAGQTEITFIKSETENIRPFYHFAFNIPENKIQAAFKWQRKKTPIVHPNPNEQKDAIVHFTNWDAHSIFFLDPAGNLVEYIARHTLPNASKGDFSVKDILHVSEIGFIVENVVDSGKELIRSLKMEEYREPSDVFWPIGDEYGLLLMIAKGKIWSSNPGKKNITDIFNTSITIESFSKGWKFPNYPYEIISNPILDNKKN